MLMNLTSPKTRVNELTAGEDGITLRSFVLSQCRRVTNGQTDCCRRR